MSADVQKALKLVEPYLEGLCREITAAAPLLREAGLSLRTIYIGGGTPTTLSGRPAGPAADPGRKKF